MHLNRSALVQKTDGQAGTGGVDPELELQRAANNLSLMAGAVKRANGKRVERGSRYCSTPTIETINPKP